MIYVDTSALLKRYLDEPDSDDAERLLAADPVLVTSWVTLVEARRNVARVASGSTLAGLRARITKDLDMFALVSTDEVVASLAADVAEQTGVRSLDAIHLGSAMRLRVPGLSYLTFDVRQAQAARSLGFHVLGV